MNHANLELMRLKKFQNGFTLLELVVSIGIIGMLSVLFVANFQPSKQSNRINSAAQNLASNIRKIENYALSLKEMPVVELADVYPHVPQRGYLLKFVQGTSTIEFCADNGDANLCHQDEHFDSQRRSDDIYLTNDHDPNIYIQNIKIDNNVRATAYVVFVPPDPKVLIAQNNPQLLSSPATTTTIVLLDNKTKKTKTVVINKFGLVDVQN